MTESKPHCAHTNFDCVVMLTWSDWHTEMRSNRYHYATRFARTHPVYFVQPDLSLESVQREEVPGHPNLTILHVPTLKRNVLCIPLKIFLERSGHRRPLLWCYNYRFAPLYCHLANALRVYHATEDYFRLVGPQVPDLAQVIGASDLIICVSEGVRTSLEERVGALPEAHVVTNGCDYTFCAERPDTNSAVDELPRPKALYQGNISAKLDYELMRYACLALPQVTFIFAGETSDCRAWQQLKQLPNVRYLGRLPAEALPGLMRSCDVGLIPFVQEDWIVKPGFPLKAFEYLALGLPVVSTPLDNLRPWDHLIRFASEPQQFVEAIRDALADNSPAVVERRQTAARAQDYEEKFAQVQNLVSRLSKSPVAAAEDSSEQCHRRKYLLLAHAEQLEQESPVTAPWMEDSCEVTVIVSYGGPEAERVAPLLERRRGYTIFRRPLVTIGRVESVGFLLTLMPVFHKCFGVMLGTRILVALVVLASLGMFHAFAEGSIPGNAVSPFDRMRHRIVGRLSSIQVGGSKTDKSFREVAKCLSKVLRTTKTLVRAVEETMAAPDIVQSSGFETLLAGVTCKKLYGCRLEFDDRQLQWGIHQDARGDASRLALVLESTFVGQVDTVMSSAAEALQNS